MLEGFFHKYAEKSGLLNYESLYARVAKNAVRRKHDLANKSQAATQAEYTDKLGRPAYTPNTNGRPFASNNSAMRHGGAQLRSVLSR